MALEIKPKLKKVAQGRPFELEVVGAGRGAVVWSAEANGGGDLSDCLERMEGRKTRLYTSSLEPGTCTVRAKSGKEEESIELEILKAASEEIVRHALLEGALGRVDAINETLESGITIKGKKSVESDDQALWVVIRECVKQRSFKAYETFITDVLCGDQKKLENRQDLKDLLTKQAVDRYYLYGVNGYQLLKAATEVFLLMHCCGGIAGQDFKFFDPDEEEPRLGYRSSAQEMESRMKEYLKDSVSADTLPYLDLIIKRSRWYTDAELKTAKFLEHKQKDYPFCTDSLRYQLCLIELIWSYFQEEGMLVQSMNAISERFQNRRVGTRNPLSNFELDPLRPLNNILWGYLQDEKHRLTVKRRAYEYDHEYGLKLVGKAVGSLDSADRRSKFIEAFHTLIHQCALFYQDDSNQFITPDPYPLLNALKSVHLVLSEGAHNQFGDLPSTARQEMLIQQWLLAQRPMREFLRTRAMVPYEEGWMGPVDAMKRLMNWTDTSVIHFNTLAVHSEKLVLSIRYGNWGDLSVQPNQARNWAIYWRTEVQGYVEAYRQATGVDLGVAMKDADRPVAYGYQPSQLLQKRLTSQGQAGAK